MKALCVGATSWICDPKGRIDKALHACIPYYAMQSLTISDIIYALMPKEGVKAKTARCTSVSAYILHRSWFPVMHAQPLFRSLLTNID